MNFMPSYRKNILALSMIVFYPLCIYLWTSPLTKASKYEAYSLEGNLIRLLLIISALFLSIGSYISFIEIRNHISKTINHLASSVMLFWLKLLLVFLLSFAVIIIVELFVRFILNIELGYTGLAYVPFMAFNAFAIIIYGVIGSIILTRFKNV